MHLTIPLALVIATVALLPQTVFANSCCYAFSSRATTIKGSPSQMVAAEARSPTDLVLAAANAPPYYAITFAAASTDLPPNGVSTSISFPQGFVIAILPKGCSYFGLFGVSCNVPSPAYKISVNFDLVVGDENGPARFDSVVLNGDTCTLTSGCSSGPPPSPPVTPPPSTTPPVTPPAQSSGVVPPVVSPPPSNSNGIGPTTTGSQSTNLPGTETGGNSDIAQPTVSSNSNGGTEEPHSGKSETGLIVGSTVGAAALVLLSSLVIIRRQKRAATAAAAAAAVAAAAASAAMEGSPSTDPRDPPWDEHPSRVAAAAAALWAALINPKRMSPRIPTMTAPWNRIYLSNNAGAGAGTDSRAEKNPQAILERHFSVQTTSDQGSVFGILDAYATPTEKDENWPSRENSISMNPALAAAVSAVKDLSVAAATGNIRHERIKRTGAGVGSGVLGASQTLVHIPEDGLHGGYEDEDTQSDFMDSVDYHHGMQDVVLAPSTNVSSELTIAPGPSTTSSEASSPLLTARARLFQAVSLASSRLRRQVSRHSWYGSPIQTHAEVAAVEEQQQEFQPRKLAGPRYPKDSIAFTRPVRTSFYKRPRDSTTNSGIFVTSIRAEHHDQQFKEDTIEPPIQSVDEFDFSNPGPPRLVPTQPSIITNAHIARASIYDNSTINNSNSQLYTTNLNNFRNSTARRGISQPIVMRSEEIHIPRVEPPHTAEILPVKPPSRYSTDPRGVPTKYEEPVYANGLYGFM